MWKPKIKKMNLFVRILTFGWAAGITLAPFGIYIKEGYENQRGIIVHEKIHWRQQLEMMVVGAIMAVIAGITLMSFGMFSWWLLLLLVFPFLFFYLWYVIEWLIKIPFNGRKAYSSISFEREANCYEYNETYLMIRKAFAWLRFIKK